MKDGHGHLHESQRLRRLSAPVMQLCDSGRHQWPSLPFPSTVLSACSLHLQLRDKTGCPFRWLGHPPSKVAFLGGRGRDCRKLSQVFSGLDSKSACSRGVGVLKAYGWEMCKWSLSVMLTWNHAGTACLSVGQQSDSAGVARTATMPVSGEWQLVEQRSASKSCLGPKPQLGTRGRL